MLRRLQRQICSVPFFMLLFQHFRPMLNGCKGVVPQELKAFWLPNKAPSAAQVIDKPDEHTYCPATGKKLKLKDLVSVRCLASAVDSKCCFVALECCALQRWQLSAGGLSILALASSRPCVGCAWFTLHAWQ